MSSSSNSTSRICFVPGLLKSEEQKESKSSLSDAGVVCSLSLSKRKGQKRFFLKHLGF